MEVVCGIVYCWDFFGNKSEAGVFEVVIIVEGFIIGLNGYFLFISGEDCDLFELFFCKVDVNCYWVSVGLGKVVE